MPHTKFLLPVAVFAVLLFSVNLCLAQEKLGGHERDRGSAILAMVKKDVKSKYFDSTFKGIDIDKRFADADEKIQIAQSVGQVMGTIAQVLLEFSDSHTRFIPPQRASRTEYGWTPTMIGNKAIVTAIKPKSDAEAKGLKVGDQIVAVDNTIIDRANLWLMKYLYYTLRPQPGMRLSILRPGKTAEEEITVLAKITQGQRLLDLTQGQDIFKLIRESENEAHLNRHRYSSVADDLFIWKMPEFDMSESQVDDMMGKVKDHKKLILDLRGNGGGMVLTLNRLIGHFFDRDITVGEWKGREEFDPQIAKTRKKDIFTGEVIVLIDSESGSSSELFARVMQLEKRAKVIGDVSSGKVMVSRFFSRQVGMDRVAFFGTSITIANVIMSDGKSLEKVGVIPDQLILPSPGDIAAGKDPVLTAAAEMLGHKIPPADAGKMFPVEWPK
jgi:carboxyl-terminal processing protease